MRTGVYVCHCGTNIATTVHTGKVSESIKRQPGVVVSRDYQYMCSDPGQELIKKDIKELNLDRVVVAACSPRMHEKTFRKVVEEAGINPYCFEMANIREQCSWVHKDTEKATKKAIEIVKSAVARASLLDSLEEREVDVIPEVLVIGGGIAGIQASLDLANAGFKTYLVEREPTIGGRMAQLDKTFPTLDCSSCILTPKMVEVGQHDNIELFTCSEVVEVNGSVGDFRVKMLKKPRYIDEDKCTGCGACAEACVLKGRIPNEFDLGIGKRGAAYIPFPQAVPLKYMIDPEHCIFLQKCKGKKPCVDACDVDAIDFDQKEEEIELNVGAIIVATGSNIFDASLKPEYRYEHERVLNSLEFERLCSASGPTAGKIRLPDGTIPKRVVFIQCVGSRDEKVGNLYCSRVCCMHSTKLSHLAKEKIPDAEVTIFYIDIRAFGKGYEEFYDRVREEGVMYRRGNVSEVIPMKDHLIVRAEDTMLGEIVEVKADLVVLAVGMVAKDDAEDLARILNITQSSDKFFAEAHPKLRPVDTFTDGIFLAGCCQGPKDIPDTVSQAKGAASAAMILLTQGRVQVEAATSAINEEICSGCRSCEEVCTFEALSFDEVRCVMTVNDVLCKGCGSCGTACPSGAISLMHFKDAQILAQVEVLS